MTTDAPGDHPAEYLRAARETLRVERRRTVDEREAFEAFRARVQRVSAEATDGDATRLRSDGAVGSTALCPISHAGGSSPRLCEPRDRFGKDW